MALRSVIQRTFQSVTSGQIPTALAVKNNARSYGRFFNNVQLLGRIGREPYQVNETDIVVFPLYTEQSYRNATGEVKTYPTWHRIVCLQRGLGTVVRNNAEKGQRVFINGRLAYRNSPDSQALSDQRAFIILEDIILLEKSKKNLYSRPSYDERDEPSASAETVEEQLQASEKSA